jgi:hypothetical protein
MPIFKVLRRRDAFVDYTTEVEADSPEAAAQLAMANAEGLSWKGAGQHEYDAESFIALDSAGDEIPSSECGDF